MNTVTIPKKKYQELMSKAMRYDYFQTVLSEDLFASPPAHSADEVVKGFKSTGRYNPDFIKSLQKGLEHSDYFKV